MAFRSLQSELGLARTAGPEEKQSREMGPGPRSKL